MKQSLKGIVVFIFMISALFGQTYLINESFGTVPPVGWSNGTILPTQGTIAQDGDLKSLNFQEEKDYAVSIVTPPVTDPDRITFYHSTDNVNAYKGTFNLSYSTNINGPWTNITTITSTSQNTFTLSANEISGIVSGSLSGTYYFQLERTGGKNSNSKNLFIDVFQVTQSIVSSETALSGFIAEPDAASPVQSFTVSGADLTGDITLTPPANYEISTGIGAGFSAANPITLTPSGGTVSSTTIYVRLKAGLSAGSYNGENITISSTGKISKTVACSGDVRQSINPSISALSNFNYDIGNGPSAEQNFTVSGQDLTGDITLTPPSNYEISTGSGAAFSAANPITLTESGGTLSATTIYVRLKAELSPGSYDDENITISSAGKVSRSVSCSGSVRPIILNVKVFLEGGL